ncbi:MAG: COX15/CtaA family protein [Solirubrobacterales bacterium]|nr:COX15/CtaA family protein [Solirubrobacterales bacterium]
MSPAVAVQRLRGLTLSRRTYFLIAATALGSLVAIVLTGAAVRLTASGLGCPAWPKCYDDQVYAAADINALIEFGNRMFTGFVGLTVIAASVLVFLRRPFRWHLAIFALLLPLGVICQAVLGALVVEYDLKPGLVMMHFILSMILLDAAFALAWCSRFEPGERRFSDDRLGVWAVRCLIPVGQLTILAGTISTASGPHPGDHEGEIVQRFDFKGADTLQWAVERHAVIATVFGLAAIATVLLLRRDGGDRRAVKPLLVVIGLLGLQGMIGGVQWALELPAGIVWVHIAVATFTWVAMLWSVAAAGRLRPREETAAVSSPERALEGAGV